MDDFLDSLDLVPAEFRRNFDLIEKLDDKNLNLIKELNKCYLEYQKPNKTKAQRQAIKKKSDDLFEKIFGYSDDKIELAEQTYEVIDKHIKKLIDIGQIKRQGADEDDDSTPGISSCPEVVALGVDMKPDPNEPRFCLCHDISHGQMIGCSNVLECLHGEWFHIGCVGLESANLSKIGKWFCPGCTEAGYGGRPKKRAKKRKL